MISIFCIFAYLFIGFLVSVLFRYLNIIDELSAKSGTFACLLFWPFTLILVGMVNFLVYLDDASDKLARKLKGLHRKG